MIYIVRITYDDPKYEKIFGIDMSLYKRSQNKIAYIEKREKYLSKFLNNFLVMIKSSSSKISVSLYKRTISDFTINTKNKCDYKNINYRKIIEDIMDKILEDFYYLDNLVFDKNFMPFKPSNKKRKYVNRYKHGNRQCDICFKY